MPLPSTRVIHPQWSEHNSRINEDPSAVNATVFIFAGSTSGWDPVNGPTEGMEDELYTGPARVSYDLDRPFTKDNADQITSTSIILVQLPRDAQFEVDPGNTVQMLSVDENGLESLANITLHVLSQRRSGLSWGTTFDCMETRGRAAG